MMIWVSAYLIRGVLLLHFFFLADLGLTVIGTKSICCIGLVHLIGNDVSLRLNALRKKGSMYS